MAWLPTKSTLGMITMFLIACSAMALLAGMSLYPIWSLDREPYTVEFKDLARSRGAGKALIVWVLLSAGFAGLVLQPVFRIAGPSMVQYAYEKWMESEFPSEWILNYFMDIVNGYMLSSAGGMLGSAASMIWWMTAPDEGLDKGFYLIGLSAGLAGLAYVPHFLTRFAPDGEKSGHEDEDQEEDPFAAGERRESTNSYGSEEDEGGGAKRWKNKLYNLGGRRGSEESALHRTSTLSEPESPRAPSGWGWW
eukprot:gb/GFBE01008195.1/.p1 GENE.gb/GFBE01008195.1/~~gb/GFBE01008195.1/.p1  ORF type:complete len:250 (+),score=42.45 gb/GFBE01008195.1/:1-750(+)